MRDWLNNFFWNISGGRAIWDATNCSPNEMSGEYQSFLYTVIIFLVIAALIFLLMIFFKEAHGNHMMDYKFCWIVMFLGSLLLIYMTYQDIIEANMRCFGVPFMPNQ